MIASLQNYCESLAAEFHLIPAERQVLLEKLAAYIRAKRQQSQPVRLVYICTHNSRRSHFGQVWAAVAAHYFKVKAVDTFSGGTEATAFHPHAISALRRVGFTIHPINDTSNPVYQVVYDDHAEPVICFSKVFDHPENPSSGFAAVMTCGEADENCPFIPGAEIRIATTYEDPKAFDGTARQDEMYDERCRQIAREVFFVFSKVS